jgi:uncharacterized protein
VRTRTALAAAGALLLVAAPAAAHVELAPQEVPKGSTTTITFRVPNERDDANTTKVAVQLPPDHPIANVRPIDVEGWRITTETDPEGRVTTITWSGGPIVKDTTEQFPVEIGPLPTDVDTLEFKAVQTYSDGEVVRWIEETPPGGEEPEHPAPTLRLSGPIVTTTSSPASPTTVGVATTNARDVTGATTATAPDDDDGGSGSVAAVAVLVVVAAAAATGLALLRRRRRA